MAELDIDTLGVEQLKEQIDKLNAALAAKLKAETDEKIAEVQAIIAAYGLTKEQLFGGAAAKAPKAAKEDGEKKVRWPSAIYFNAQAPKGEELHLSRGANKPSWLTEDNKDKYKIRDIAEQIKLIEQYDPENDKPVSSRKAWLEANPDKTQSKD